MRKRTTYEIKRETERKKAAAQEIIAITRLRDTLMRDFPMPDRRLKIIDAVRVLVR